MDPYTLEGSRRFNWKVATIPLLVVLVLASWLTAANGKMLDAEGGDVHRCANIDSQASCSHILPAEEDICATVYMRHSFVPSARFGEWEVNEQSFATIFTPIGNDSHSMELKSDEGTVLVEIPSGGAVVVTDEWIALEFVSPPVLNGQSAPRSDGIFSLDTPCWPTSALRSYTYQGGCWSPLGYDANLMCWIRSCTVAGECDLHVVPLSGDPETLNGQCDHSPVHRTTLCGGQLCFEMP